MAILEQNLAWRIQGPTFTIIMDFGTAKVKPTSCYVNASASLDDCRLLGNVDNQEYVLIHLIGHVHEPRTYEWQTNRYYRQLRFQGVRSNFQTSSLQISTFEIFGELQT